MTLKTGPRGRQRLSSHAPSLCWKAYNNNYYSANLSLLKSFPLHVAGGAVQSFVLPMQCHLCLLCVLLILLCSCALCSHTCSKLSSNQQYPQQGLCDFRQAVKAATLLLGRCWVQSLPPMRPHSVDPASSSSSCSSLSSSVLSFFYGCFFLFRLVSLKVSLQKHGLRCFFFSFVLSFLGFLLYFACDLSIVRLNLLLQKLSRCRPVRLSRTWSTLSTNC